MITKLPIFCKLIIILLLNCISIKCQEDIAQLLKIDFQIDNESIDEDQMQFLSTLSKCKFKEDSNTDEIQFLNRKLRDIGQNEKNLELDAASGSGFEFEIVGTGVETTKPLIIDGFNSTITVDKIDVKEKTTTPIIIDATEKVEVMKVTEIYSTTISSTLLPMYSKYIQFIPNSCIFVGCKCTASEIACTNHNSVPERLNSQDIDIELLTLSKIKNFYHLPDKYFEGIKTKILNISNNPSLVRLLQHSFTGILGLKRLILNKNKIATLDHRVFEPLNELEIDELSLESNDLQTFHYLIKFPKNLKVLNLAGNQIGNLSPSLFNGSSQLKILNLRSNSLRRINARQFVMLKKLEILDLKDNSINYLDTNWLDKNESTIKINKEDVFERLTRPKS